MSIRLVLGLGNPGARYAETRHNVGFRVVDELGVRCGVGAWRREPLVDLLELDLGSGLLAAKPLTYMNRSGSALEWLIERFAVDPAEVLVVVDDLDLVLGRLRLRRRGGPGTHNGLRDLCRIAGTGYPRLRVGVRGDGEPDDLADWVTSPFAAGEREVAEDAVRRAADAVEAVVRDGFAAAMNVFNRADADESDESDVSRES
jgi:PTH1 family peptidyl-tRNA hydrolase